MSCLPSGVSQGLVVDEPWISKILCGDKTWEMRSTPTNKKGRFALLKKGTGLIVGYFSLVESSGPYSVQQLKDSYFYHQIPDHVLNDPDYKWKFAWVMHDIEKLDNPIPYKHKNGAVIWVNLNESDSNLDDPKTLRKPKPAFKPVSASFVSNKNITSFDSKVPVAKDGSTFDRDICMRNGSYTVGEKGDEQKFTSFEDALKYLRAMPKAKWRRPNSKGNWGIVSAVNWITLES